MKNIKKSLATGSLKAVQKMAVSSLKVNANSTTCGAIYQPKAPKALDSFKKLGK